MQQKIVSLNNNPVGYFREGSGFPVVFVHGFPMDHTAWTFDENFLKPVSGMFSVILPDNAGYGKSALPGHDLTMDYYADSIKAVLDAEKIKECLMIGHSMGGYMVLNFAKRFPGYLKGFGLFSSTAYADDEAKKQNRIEVAEAVRKSDAATFVNGMLHKLFGEKYSSAHEKEITAMKEYFGSVTTAEAIAQASLAMGKREDTTAVLKDTKVPVLFLIGKDDKVVPPEKTLPLTHLPERSVIGILDETGHMGMVESPDESQRKVAEWAKMCLDQKAAS